MHDGFMRRQFLISYIKFFPISFSSDISVGTMVAGVDSSGPDRK